MIVLRNKNSLRLFQLVLAPVICLSFHPLQLEASNCDVRALLIGSHSRGVDHWISIQSYFIENMLKFNGVPYDFFDIYADDLDQSSLDMYDGVILEGYSLYWDATEEERSLVAENMEAGNITVLLGLVSGEFTGLNSTLYDAIDVSVDGLGDSEANIHPQEGASNIYDYEGDDGFVIAGGYAGKHIGLAALPLSGWTGVSPVYEGNRTYGLEFALERWLENAFGIDARVTLPVISLRLDDTQTLCGPRNQAVIDFIDTNKSRIRASGYLVTDASAYQTSDSALRSDEQVISEWGSMSLHGKDHAAVGAEGENQDYLTQYDETNTAVNFLQQNFSRYKPIKACPMNSWNEATLHAMYENGIYYHSACMSGDYIALYNSLFDVSSDMEREKMKVRLAGQLPYYPLIHMDQSGEARIYSVDWHVIFSGTSSPQRVPAILRSCSLDWWTPLMVGSHFCTTFGGGAFSDPIGWMGVMSALMYAVDHETYSWRRWVDNYDFARNVQRFDENLEINRISIAGNTVTYDITADRPIRFMTLRAKKTGYMVASATINGIEYTYFGHDYVQLPEVSGNAVIVVDLAPQGSCRPHVTYVSPSAVVEDATCSTGKLRLTLSGEFVVTADVIGTSKVFDRGATRVFHDNKEELRIDASCQIQTEQVELSLLPSCGSIEAVIDTWGTSGTQSRKWTEISDFDEPFMEPEDTWSQAATSGPADHRVGGGRPRKMTDGDDAHIPGMEVEHIVGDLEPNTLYVVKADNCPLDTCLSNGLGEISFSYCAFYSPKPIEVVMDSTASSGVSSGGASTRLEPGRDFYLKTYPNPFGYRTTISYHLPRPSRVTLRIYSVGGRLVCQILDDTQQAGWHSVEWNGHDVSADGVSPGVYLLRLETVGAVKTREVVLLK